MKSTFIIKNKTKNVLNFINLRPFYFKYFKCCYKAPNSELSKTLNMHTITKDIFFISNHQFGGWFASCPKKNIFGKIKCSFFIARAANKILSQWDSYLSLVKCIVTRHTFEGEALFWACAGSMLKGGKTPWGHEENSLSTTACIVLSKYFLIKFRCYFF